MAKKWVNFKNDADAENYLKTRNLIKFRFSNNRTLIGVCLKYLGHFNQNDGQYFFCLVLANLNNNEFEPAKIHQFVVGKQGTNNGVNFDNWLKLEEIPEEENPQH